MEWKRGLLHSPAYQDLHGALSMTTQSVTASEYVWISSSTSSTLIVLSHLLCTRHCAKNFPWSMSAFIHSLIHPAHNSLYINSASPCPRGWRESSAPGMNALPPWSYQWGKRPKTHKHTSDREEKSRRRKG